MRVEWSPCVFSAVFFAPGKNLPRAKGRSGFSPTVVVFCWFFCQDALPVTGLWSRGTPGSARFQTVPLVRSVGASGVRSTQLAEAC